MRVFAAIAVLFMVLCVGVRAGEPQVLSGVVMAPGEPGDRPFESYVPLEGVRVEVRGQKVSTTTDDMGMFLLDGVPEGEHTLILRADGFETFRRRVRVDRRTGTLSFVMLPEVAGGR